MKKGNIFQLFLLFLIFGLILGFYYPKQQIITAFNTNALNIIKGKPASHDAAMPIESDTKNSNDNTDQPTKVQTTKTLESILADKGVDNPGNRLSISIIKSNHTLTIFLEGQPLKTYHVEFGEGGMDAKRASGDHKTPEGSFYVTEKSVLTPVDYYLGSRWMRLSYPNIGDARRGLSDNLIDRTTYGEIVNAINEGKTPPQRTTLGGGIGIHGGDIPEFGENWTWGCIGLSNKDVEEIYDFINIGTPVSIKR